MPIYLADVIRTLAGWPVDLDIAAGVLDVADNVLAADGGRACRRALSPEELTQFNISADSIPPREPLDRQWPIRISADLHRRIRDCAENSGLSMNLWAVQALLAQVLVQEGTSQ